MGISLPLGTLRPWLGVGQQKDVNIFNVNLKEVTQRGQGGIMNDSKQRSETQNGSKAGDVEPKEGNW